MGIRKRCIGGGKMCCWHVDEKCCEMLIGVLENSLYPDIRSILWNKSLLLLYTCVLADAEKVYFTAEVGKRSARASRCWAMFSDTV